MIKTVLLLINILSVSVAAFAQSNQQKAETLVKKYLTDHHTFHTASKIRFSNVERLNSSYTGTKTYKNYQRKIDSLKLEGRKIDARIVKMKTDAELNQAKKDSKNLSDQLVATSDALINFMTGFKTTFTGWKLVCNQNIKPPKRIFYLDKTLSKVTGVK